MPISPTGQYIDESGKPTVLSGTAPGITYAPNASGLFEVFRDGQRISTGTEDQAKRIANQQVIEPTVMSSSQGRKLVTETQQDLERRNQGIAKYQAPKPTETKTSATDDAMKSMADEVKDPAQKQLDDTDTFFTGKVNEVYKLVDSMRSSIDASTAALLDSLATQYESRKADLLDLNKRQLAFVTTAGIRSGGARYASEINQGFLGAEEAAGINRLNQLQRDYMSAVSEAKAASEAKKYDLMWKSMETVNDLDTKRRSEVSKLLETQAKQTEKIAEQRQKMEEDERIFNVEAVVSDSISSGMTDVSDIYRNVVTSGLKASTKEVKSAVDALKIAEKTAPGVVGEWLALKENDPELANITLADYLDIKDPGRALDIQQQKLQIAKLQKDLNDKGVSEDPSNIIAYAQQYASTGTIPPGLPKGTFGIVSEVAKGLPKPVGVLVDVSTGVKPSAMSSTQVDGLTALYDVTKKVDTLRELNDNIVHGVTGKVTALFDQDDRRRYLDLRKEIVDLLARARTGAAITEFEERNYSSRLPGLGADPFFAGASPESRIDSFDTAIQGALQTKLKVNNSAIYGYSKVKVGNQEYTVGDVVTNESGQTGRVNADGSITVLSE